MGQEAQLPSVIGGRSHVLEKASGTSTSMAAEERPQGQLSEWTTTLGLFAGYFRTGMHWYFKGMELAGEGVSPVSIWGEVQVGPFAAITMGPTGQGTDC